ncbi:MFS transporter [Acuticoccus sediminis]|uniref:MFS transporter n=1 Tax=Acuticoccus sediminis TaxID=2184697 RepID=A0A8B2NWD3_9HYPH|nr:sugar porter family MFS transporter [Acuticoccus sediminis]RAI00661.1 MFS transporter [Acuticoccus sediminis]
MTLGSALLRLIALAALFGFLFGFDEGIIAGALPFISTTFTVTPASEGLMTAAVPLGAVLGVVLAAVYSDRLGRRRVLMLCALVFVAGSILSGAADGMEMLTLSRLLLGIAIGASSMAAPMFLAELAPPAVRGAVVSAFQLMITVGILISYLVSLGLAPFEQWRVMLALGMVPAAVALVGILRSPESPRWLVLRGRDDEARATIAKLEPTRSPVDIEHLVKEIRANIAHTPDAARWGAFLAPRVLPVVVFAMVLFFLQQLSGINAVIYYAPKIMSEAGLPGVHAQLFATVGIGTLNVAMTIVAMMVVDRMGRRPLLIGGFVGAAASLAFIAYTFATPENDSIIALAGLVAYIAFFAVSLGPLPWLYMSELFPIRLKTRGMALAACANWAMNFLVVFLFPVVLAGAGAAVTFGIFAAFCAFGVVFAYLMAPETKGVSLEEIERTLEAPVG